MAKSHGSHRLVLGEPGLSPAKRRRESCPKMYFQHCDYKTYDFVSSHGFLLNLLFDRMKCFFCTTDSLISCLHCQLPGEEGDDGGGGGRCMRWEEGREKSFSVGFFANVRQLHTGWPDQCPVGERIVLISVCCR